MQLSKPCNAWLENVSRSAGQSHLQGCLREK